MNFCFLNFLFNLDRLFFGKKERLEYRSRFSIFIKGNSFNKIFIKKWFNLAWLPLYPSLSIMVDGLGIAIFSIITGSVIVVDGGQIRSV